MTRTSSFWHFNKKTSRRPIGDEAPPYKLQSPGLAFRYSHEVNAKVVNGVFLVTHDELAEGRRVRQQVRLMKVVAALLIMVSGVVATLFLAPCIRACDINTNTNGTNETWAWMQHGVERIIILAGQSNAEGNTPVRGLEQLANQLCLSLGQDCGHPIRENTRRLREASSIKPRWLLSENDTSEFLDKNLNDYSHLDESLARISLEHGQGRFCRAYSSLIDWYSLSPSMRRNVLNCAQQLRNISFHNISEPVSGIRIKNVLFSDSEPVIRYDKGDITKLIAGQGWGLDGKYFGPELSLGRYLKASSSGKTVILKVARGGSSLASHWTKGGTLYDSLISEAKSLRELAKGAPIISLVWFQGYSDQTPERRDKYHNNLERFIQNVREDLGLASPDNLLPVVIVKAQEGLVHQSILNSQEKVAKEVPEAYLVETSKLSNCFHYDSASMMVIGQRIGKVLSSIISNRGGS